ncbi:MAG: hypothetical protein RR543_02430 [Erysipelotrichales bacterium]
MKVRILTEGSSEFGFGHMVRCSTISKYARNQGYDVEYLIDGDSTSNEYIKENDALNFNWKNESYLENNINEDDIVIVDSYYVTYGMLSIINSKAKKCAVIDDLERFDYKNFIVINPNFCAEVFDLNKEDNTYLFGGDYIFLREEFVGYKFAIKNKNVKEVLITFGGSDVLNMTPNVIDYLLSNYSDIKLKVVVGFGFQNIEQIKKHSTSRVELLYNVDANEMRNLMLNTDFTICAAGQTVNEILKLGVPACFMKVIDNQQPNIDYFKMIDYRFILEENDFSKIDELFIIDNRNDAVDKFKDINNDRLGAQNLFEYLIEKRV